MSFARNIANGIVSADAVSLFNIRRKLRAVPDLGDFGILPNATTYGQADFDAMVTSVVANGGRRILAPAGNYRLGEQITINRGLTIEGEHKSHTLFKMYHSGTGLVFNGALETGGGLHSLSIINDSGGAALAYLQLVASIAGTSPDFFTIDDCNMTGFSGATVSYGVIGDGNARDGSAPNGLAGLRDFEMSATQIFNCNVASTELRHVKSFRLVGVEHNQAGGAVAKLTITGSGSTKRSYGGRVIGCAIGDISLDHAEKIIGDDNDIGNAILSANALLCNIGKATGTIDNNSPTSTVQLLDPP